MKNKFSIKRVVFLLFIILGIIIIGFFPIGYDNPQTIMQGRDNSRLQDMNIIKETLKGYDKFEFTSLREYNGTHKQKIKSPKYCYFVSGVDNGNSYILAFKIESKKFKKRLESDFYLYKSDEKYIIDELTNKRMYETIQSEECFE